MLWTTRRAHPSQIETVNRLYSPDLATYARAEGILAAYVRPPNPKAAAPSATQAK